MCRLWFVSWILDSLFIVVTFTAYLIFTKCISFVMTKMKTLASVIFTVVYTAFVLFLALVSLRDQLNVYRNSHIVEFSEGRESIPTSYFSLDWIMHPRTSHKNKGYSRIQLIQPELCWSSGWEMRALHERQCAPQLWQTTDFCPAKAGNTVTTTLIASVQAADSTLTEVQAKTILQQLTFEDDLLGEHGLVAEGDNSVWKNPNMADVCKIERISKYASYANDDAAWSIGGSHSTVVLLLGAAGVMWIVNILEFMHDMAATKETKDSFERAVKRIQYLEKPLVLIFVLFFIALRVMTDSEKIVKETVYNRIMPNGSYFYAIVTIFLTGYFMSGIKNRKNVSYNDKDPKNKQQYESLIQRNTFNMQSENASEGTLMLDTSGFNSHRKIGAYMAKTAPHKTGRESDQWDQALTVTQEKFEEILSENIHMDSSPFCVAQLFTLPLLVLGIFTVNTSVDIDSNFQLLFGSVIVFGLIDFFVYRLMNVATIFMKLTDVKVHGKSLLGKIRIIDVLGILLQVVVFYIIYMTMNWHLGMIQREQMPLVAHDSYYERIQEIIPLFFIIYFVMSTVVKLLHLFASYEGPTVADGQPKARAMYNYASTVSKYNDFIQMSLLNVFVAVNLLLICIMLYSVEYKEPFSYTHPTADVADQLRLDMAVDFFRNGWETVV